MAMFGFLKKMCDCGSDDLKTRQKKAHEQDKRVREKLSEKQIDKGVKDTMDASDPVAKY
jgi:hypothetical protein